MENAKSYVYVIERAEDGSYWAYLPDLPGFTTTADSPDRSRANFAKPWICISATTAIEAFPPRRRKRVSEPSAPRERSRSTRNKS